MSVTCRCDGLDGLASRLVALVFLRYRSLAVDCSGISKVRRVNFHRRVHGVVLIELYRARALHCDESEILLGLSRRHGEGLGLCGVELQTIAIGNPQHRPCNQIWRVQDALGGDGIRTRNWKAGRHDYALWRELGQWYLEVKLVEE
jgi:hypothetical protein